MTAGKDDLTKKTQLGYKVGEDSSTGLYHQAELGFSDGVRFSSIGRVWRKLRAS